MLPELYSEFPLHCCLYWKAVVCTEKMLSVLLSVLRSFPASSPSTEAAPTFVRSSQLWESSRITQMYILSESNRITSTLLYPVSLFLGAETDDQQSNSNTNKEIIQWATNCRITQIYILSESSQITQISLHRHFFILYNTLNQILNFMKSFHCPIAACTHNTASTYTVKGPEREPSGVCISDIVWYRCGSKEALPPLKTSGGLQPQTPLCCVTAKPVQKSGSKYLFWVHHFIATSELEINNCEPKIMNDNNNTKTTNTATS